MLEQFECLIASLNSIGNFKNIGEASRGKFELVYIKDSLRMGIQVNFVDKLHPEQVHHILMKYYEFNPDTPINIEYLFIKSAYDEFIRIMLYLRRCELVDGKGNPIRCIPIADLIQTGLD